MTAMFLHNMVTDNGKTIKENNLEKTHSFKCGALVEIEDDNYLSYGVRLFVVMQIRDCNGRPLYLLSHTIEDMHEEHRNIQRMSNAFRESELMLIREP